MSWRWRDTMSSGGHDTAQLGRATAIIKKNMQRQAARGLIREDQDRARAGARPHLAKPGRHARPRSRHRGGHRRRSRQAKNLQRYLPAPIRQGDDRHHTSSISVDAAGRFHRPARALHRPAFHEPGAGDAAGGSHPRHRHDDPTFQAALEIIKRVGKTAAYARISRPSSSTASCCR